MALVTAVQPLGEGKYILDTVEGNLNARIRRYQYIYDSLAERKERNITAVPRKCRPIRIPTCTIMSTSSTSTFLVKRGIEQ